MRPERDFSQWQAQVKQEPTTNSALPPRSHQDVTRIAFQGSAEPIDDVQTDCRRLPRLDAGDVRLRHPHYLGELFLAQPGGLALLEEAPPGTPVSFPLGNRRLDSK